MTRADYVSLNIFPRGKTKQSLNENLISTECVHPNEATQGN